MAANLVPDVTEHVPPLGATAGFASLYLPYNYKVKNQGGESALLCKSVPNKDTNTNYEHDEY